MVKRAVVYCLVCMFTLFSVFPLSAQKRESWQKLERNGQGYGYDHIVAEDCENGNIKYEIYQTIKTDIAGYNPQDITQTGFYIVDKNMNPVALDLYIKFKSRETHIKGENRDRTLYLTRQIGNEEIQKLEIPSENIYFEVVLGNVIFQKKDQVNFTLSVFNPVEGKVNDYDVEVIPDDKGSIIAKVKERITMIFYIDNKGLVKQIKFVELNSRSYVTTAKNARRINYLNTADGLTLTVLCKPQFPNVWDINKAQVSIKWR
jgi:hypothetical protein